MTRQRINYGSNIPRARELLGQIASDIGGDDGERIRDVVRQYMHQKKQSDPRGHSRRQWREVTEDEKRELMRRYATGDYTLQQLADWLGVGAGRVAEFLNGQRS